MKRAGKILSLCLLFPLYLPTQHVVSGKVTDAGSGRPISFVNVVTKPSRTGTVTGINGKFSLEVEQPQRSITFSFIGYKTRTLNLGNKKNQVINVALKKTSYRFKEVVVYPGRNPAHRIIRKVIQNRGRHRLKSMAPLTYHAYHQYLMNPDTLESSTFRFFNEQDTPTTPADTSGKDIREFLQKSYIMYMETVTKTTVPRQGKPRQNILATQFSGFKKPGIYSSLAQQQPHPFYNEMLTFLQQKFLNPVAKGFERNYAFILEDTLYQEGDSVFVITFFPSPGKNFKGMEGRIFVNNDGYAIQNITVHPKVEGTWKLRIQQKYRQLGDTLWFPSQIKSNYLFTNFEVGKYPMELTGQPFIRKVNFRACLKFSLVSPAPVEIEKNAGDRLDTFWLRYRGDTLSTKEKNTFKFWDTIDPNHKFEKILHSGPSFLKGNIPVGFLNPPLKYIEETDEYQGFRLGAGAETNDKLSRNFSIGGFAGYGFKDKIFSYGGYGSLRILNASQLTFHLSWKKDVEEPGNRKFYKERSFFNKENYRDYLVEKMYLFREGSAWLSARLFRNLRIKGEYLQKKVWTNDEGNFFWNYRKQENKSLPGPSFTLKEEKIKLRWAPNETYAKLSGMELPLKSANWTFYLNLTHGRFSEDPVFNDYYKTEVQMERSFFTKNLGKSTLQLEAGKTFGKIPAFSLYNGYGSGKKEKTTLEIPSSFQTMQVNEFLNDRYVFLFFRHNFGSLLLKKKHFSPAIIVSHNAGFGWLQKRSYLPEKFQPLDQGYYEAGLTFANLFSFSNLGFGIGAFYRYGPYTRARWQDNVFFVLSLDSALSIF